jgi:hypothetical protein
MRAIYVNFQAKILQFNLCIIEHKSFYALDLVSVEFILNLQETFLFSKFLTH